MGFKVFTMKRYFVSIAVLLVLNINLSYAQNPGLSGKVNDTTKKRAEVANGIILVPNAVPVHHVDTLQLKVPSAGPAISKMLQATAEGVDAGRTSGAIDVSSTGGAMYNVPIVLPAGLGISVPQLALSYNSQGGNGIAGYGWNVTGISSISRIPATTFHDQRMGGINLDQNDRFALDGQRLILKSGIYGANGAEYQTESYSNVRIFSHGLTSWGPEYFEVQFPDGSKVFYGKNTDSRTQLDYAITYSESPLGARINYSYNVIENILYIKEINYGNLGTAAGTNKVSFSYVTSSRQEQAYNAGLLFSKTMIVNKISVFGNGVSFRNYLLSYDVVPTLNYQRLSAIQETDGAGTKSFDPIYFSYGSTGDLITVDLISNLSLSGIASHNSKIMTADFTGNGAMDFILYPNDKSKLYAFYDPESNSANLNLGYEINTGKFRDIFPVSWLTANNKVLTGQGMVLVKKEGGNGSISYKFELFSAGITAPVYFQYDRIWAKPPLGPAYLGCDGQSHNTELDLEFISGDFNGDGLTDLVGINRPKATLSVEDVIYDDPFGGGSFYRCEEVAGAISSSAYLINLDRRIVTNFIKDLGTLTKGFALTDRMYTGDMNGDGKTDILQISGTSMYVYTVNAVNSIELLWQADDNRISSDLPAFLGDYNGDGKMDIMFATNQSSSFITFMSTGKSFVKIGQYHPFSNREGSIDGQPGSQTRNSYFLIPNDIDGDGKTDMILGHTTTQDNSSNGIAEIIVYYNSGATSTSSGPSFGSGVSRSWNTSLKHGPIPIFLSPDRPNHKLEFGFISNNSISLFEFVKDFRIETQITNILQSGVNHKIEYKNMTTVDSNIGTPLYRGGQNQTYPYVDLQSAPGLRIVSKLTKYFGADSGLPELKQQFYYANAVSHVEGLGFLGFGELIRSNWHVGDNDNNRIYNIGIHDPQLRGAMIKSFTSKSTNVNSTIKSIALTNPPPTSGIVDGASLTDYISRTDQKYFTLMLPNKVYVNTLVASATKDMLTNSFGTQVLEYDTYYNNTKTTNNFGGAGTKVVEITYGNSPGSLYYIGRPLTTKTTLNNGSSIFSTQEEFVYTGFLPTQIKKKSNATAFSIENLVYDTFGNVTKKTLISPTGQQRTVSMAYDPSGRFMIQDTDAEGMIVKYVSDPITGNLKSKTNPYGQIESYEYDTWGRQIKRTDYFNVLTSRSYQRAGYDIHITETDAEGRQKISIINRAGQTTEIRQKNMMGMFIGNAWKYDAYGRSVAESETEAPGSYNQWNSTAYDEYGRIRQTVSFTGKTTNFTYAGLNTTISDGTKSATTTKNALGQTIQIQDPGGMITYSYFANGEMKTSNYDGITQTMEQDGWGRKTKLTDPSAGVYQYEYDGFGQLTKEITPKGTTQYTFDAFGKLEQKKITGDGTSLSYVYAYDPVTKLVKSMNLTNSDGNNAVYSYTYDSNKRLSSSMEDNLHARFEKSYTYDGYGHVSTERYKATNKLNQLVAEKIVEMKYQNGKLVQTSLQGTGEIIWKVSSLDGKGRLKTALQGTAVKNDFQYDQYGLPLKNTLEKITGTSVTLMSLGYNFNGQRGILNSRSNSAFSWNENFSYDNLDRLTNFNDNNANNSQGYDSRGRITTNSQLGNYNYESNTYKQSGLDLNVAGDIYYKAHALQQVSFNAFKSPIEIIELGRERVSFQYNAALGRSHMYYGDEKTDKMLRRYRKHYAEDGGMEITNDILTGTTSFIFYLGGDGYTAPAIWKEVHKTGQVTKNLYFLHRDDLGSIVMITNDQGGIVEKRLFDAWGNVVKLTDGLGNNLAAFGILDRGYTGHEHLLGVGLIHMNGRLYDPKLHRFLSPDNFVQDPYTTQSFNRFGYAMNNPLMYTDPSGEFLWAFVAIGAMIGALTGGISYAASAIRTGDWSWSGLGMSMLTGAVIGGVTGGINPGAVIGQSIGKTFATAFVSGLMPAANITVGDFGFSLSPSVAFGKSFGIGANLSVSYGSKWSISGGFGFMYYGNYQGFGKSGAEIRASAMGAYDNGKNGFSIGTNFWRGTGEMKEFKQQTGMIGLHFGEFRAMYENDGSIGAIGDDGDGFRTAALNLSIGDYTVGFNLFTGQRDYAGENGSVTTHRDPSCVDDYGRRMPNGIVKEINTPYRLGLLTVGYKNNRFGVNSEHIRHAIQDQAFHNLKIPWFNGKSLIDKRQMGFANQSWDWQGYAQYKTRNIFSSW